MRGDDQKRQPGMFSYVALEDRIPQEHPLRAIRKLVDQVLAGMSKQFDRLYSEVGRPSIPPERLLRALLLQVCSTRSAAKTCSWSNSITTCCTAGL
jgi:transposase